MKKPTVLYVDGDLLAYKFAAATQVDIEWDADTHSRGCDVEESIRRIEQHLGRMKNVNMAKGVRVALSSDTCFRNDILPEYKGNRDNPRPDGLAECKAYLVDKWDAECVTGLEADDLLGIWMTEPDSLGVNAICMSIDKDMYQIPGVHRHLHNLSEAPAFITEESGFRIHMRQTLMGDSTDNYKGCPGIGKVKADKIIEPFLSPKDIKWQAELWEAVVAAFESKGLTEDDALVQARCAKILQFSDYDFEKKEPILWNPPKLVRS